MTNNYHLTTHTVVARQPKILFREWEQTGLDMPTQLRIYTIRSVEITHWIQAQPIHMWKPYDVHDYLFTKEMEAWFMLRWS